MRAVLLHMLFLFAALANGQSFSIIHSSGYKHNYAVGELYYLESKSDTTNVKYIATIEIKDQKIENKLYMVNWYELLEPKAVDMGANLFYVEKFTKQGSSACLLVKVYFGGSKFLGANKSKANKGLNYVLYPDKNQFKTEEALSKEEISTFVYHTGAKPSWNTNGVNKTSSTMLRVRNGYYTAGNKHYRVPGPEYICIPANNSGAVNTATSGTRFDGNYAFNYAFDYEVGRMMLDMYK